MSPRRARICAGTAVRRCWKSRNGRHTACGRPSADALPVQYVNRPNLDFGGMPALWRLVASKPESALKCCRPAWNPAWRVSSLLMATKKKPVRARSAITPVPTTTLILAAAICCWRQNETLAPARTPRSMWYGWRNSRWRRAKATIAKLAGKKTRARVSRLFAIIDINNLTQRDVESLPLNGIGLVEMTFDEPLALIFISKIR